MTHAASESRRARSIAGCLAFGVASLLAIPAVAQPEPGPPDALLASSSDEGVLAALGSPDYAVRDEATRRLLVDPARDAASIGELWDRAEDMETRHRLLGVLRHRFLAEQADAMFPAGGRGAIGVSHRTLGELADEPVGAQVVTTLPGFPGHAYLREGDVITAVDGQPLQAGEGVEVLSERVQQLQQGDFVRLTVWRRGASREVAFPLGSMNALVAMYAGQGLGEPFASRLEAMERELWAAVPGESRGPTPHAD